MGAFRRPDGLVRISGTIVAAGPSGAPRRLSRGPAVPDAYAFDPQPVRVLGFEEWLRGQASRDDDVGSAARHIDDPSLLGDGLFRDAVRRARAEYEGRLRMIRRASSRGGLRG